MTLPSCNPKLGYKVTDVMSTYYPERLGLALCVNHSPVFQGIWNAIKVFLHPNTVAKMALIRGKKKVRETFDRYFSEDLRDWLLTEIKLNKQSSIPKSQMQFWKKPDNPTDHYPRGCPSYVEKYIDIKHNQKASSGTKCHIPHPNIMDVLNNTLVTTNTDSPESKKSLGAEADADFSSSDTEDVESLADHMESIEIGQEYQIPTDAVKIQ